MRQTLTLTVRPAHGEPFRWLPRHGDPLCIGEWASQTVWRHRLMIYVAFVSTLTLLVVVFGVPFVEGR